jgi:Predicted periplasmic protein
MAIQNRYGSLGKKAIIGLPLKEFISKSGDCEDYSIVKYYALKSLGIPVENMRIVVLNDSIRNLDHSVLAVDVDGKIYILDNVSNLVFA